MNKIRILLLFCVFTLLSVSASADPVLWTFTGAIFSDGGTGSGSFIYDADTQQYSAVNILTTMGAVRQAAAYHAVVASKSSQLFGVFATASGNQTGLPGLNLFYLANLTNAGGTVGLATGTVGGSIEVTCANSDCSSFGTPQRFLTEGSLVGTPVNTLSTQSTGATSLMSYSRTLPVVQAALTSGIITAAAIDQAGYVYLAGSTQNSALPTTPGVVQPVYGGNEDAFVIKLDPTGAIVYATYLGGSGFDRATSITTDNYGYAYVGGITMPGTGAAKFPTTTPSPFPGTAPGTSFIAKIDPDGSGFLYSFIVPGTKGKTAITNDATGKTYFAASAGSGFPVTSGTLQGRGSIVAGKLDELGTTLMYAARFGGSSANEAAADIAIDGGLNAYITGTTSSADFPVTLGAFQATLHGSSAAFAAKLNTIGSSLVYATYLGGSKSESASQIRIDAYGDAFVLGASQSTDFPVTAGAYQPVNSDTANTAFLAKLNPTGSGLGYATYISGVVGLSAQADPSSSVGAFDIDGPGDAFIVSRVNGSFKTTSDAFQAAFGGGSDCGLIKLDQNGVLAAASFLGGSGNETPTAVAVAPNGTVTLAGTTNSTNFPVTTGAAPTSLTSFVSQLQISNVVTPIQPTYFQVGDGDGNTLVVRFTLPDAIRNAWEAMRGKKQGIMYGKVIRAKAFYNPQWEFHVDTTTVYIDEPGTEICDSTIALIVEEGDKIGGHFLPYLLWCPWNTQFLAQVPNPSDEANHIRHESAADSAEVALAPSSLVAAVGTQLAATSLFAPAGQTVTTLGGVSVSLKDSLGQTWAGGITAVAPNQVTYQLPSGVAIGRVMATVNTSDGRSITEEIYVQPVSPSLFTVGTSNFPAGYLTRITANGTVTNEPIVQTDPVTGVVTAVPIDLGPETDQVYLSLLGTAIRNRPTLSYIHAESGRVGAYLNPTYAGPVPQYAGVDQINFLLPRVLIGLGASDWTVTSNWPYMTDPSAEQFRQRSQLVQLVFK